MASVQDVLLLLRQAAELEHQLMVQYLFAAYSLKTEPEEFAGAADPGASAERNKGWRNAILAVAREEMGHLITVQQVILSLGGRPHFDRDSFPITSGFYPFTFTLEPLTRTSLARYLWTEKPMEDPAQGLTRDVLLKDLRADIETDIYPHPPNELGRLYKAILDGLDALDPGAFRWDVESQTDVESWPGLGAMAIVERIKGKSVAIRAIEKIVEQGEGHLHSATHSHFQQFFEIYAQFPADGEVPARNVATNPNTAEPNRTGFDVDRSRSLTEGQITSPRTLPWARLFNKRYAVLLAELTHALSIPDVASDGPPPRRKPTLTEEELKKLETEAIAKLPIADIKALSTDLMKVLTSDQINALSRGQVRALAEYQIEALGTPQLETLTREKKAFLTPPKGEAVGRMLRNRERREMLIRWARDEMTLVLAPIAKRLTLLPVNDDTGSKCAGAPFELDGTGPTMPEEELVLWLAHQRLIDETRQLLRGFKSIPDHVHDPDDLFTVIGAIDRDRADYVAKQLVAVNREDKQKAEAIIRDISGPKPKRRP